MDRYRIIGKTRQVTGVFLKNKDDDTLRQHRIVLGKQIEVNEDQLTFHVQRLLAKKDIQLVNLNTNEVMTELSAQTPTQEDFFVSEETPGVGVSETQSKEAIAPPKKRGRKKKKTT